MPEGVYCELGAKIINQTSIGEYAAIGARAVVVHDVPDRAVAVGVSAKVVKYRRFVIIKNNSTIIISLYNVMVNGFYC